MDRRPLVVVAVALLLLGGVGIAALGPWQSTPEPAPDPAEPRLQLGQIEQANETEFRVTVFEQGDARWTVEYRTRLTDEGEVEDFKQYAEQFNTQETQTFTNFKQRADQLTQGGTEITDREMNATAFQRTARYSEISRDGVIQMSFRWVGFAELTNQQVMVSDVFDGGFVIFEDQRLRIERGENLSFDSLSPAPDQVDSGNESAPGEWVEWSGYREFDGGAIDARLSPPTTTIDNSDGQENGDDTTTDSENADGDESNTDGSSSDMMVPLLMLLLIVLGVGVTVAWYTVSRSPQPEQSTASAETAPQASAGPAEPEDELETEQLLSDEDRVMKLLEDNGGRMRQVSIVEETEWSKSKVSMLLSDMEDDGEISKLRVGRENIISLAGEEPEAAGSPFDDDE
jgi:uncharacterized membrane protein